jgi:hypothetical protein
MGNPFLAVGSQHNGNYPNLSADAVPFRNRSLSHATTGSGLNDCSGPVDEIAVSGDLMVELLVG